MERTQRETDLYEHLKQIATQQTSQCAADMKKLIYVLYGTAWAFFFMANSLFCKLISGVTILLVLLYHAFGVYRMYAFAKHVRVLHEQLRKGEISDDEIQERFNHKSDWTFHILGVQFILFVFIMLFFCVYIIGLIL